MGLEAINFFFTSKQNVKNLVEEFPGIKYFGGKRYVYEEEGIFWIDIELQDVHSISLRIALCNSKDKILYALNKLLPYLFSFGHGILTDLNTKKKFTTFDKIVTNEIDNSYSNRRKSFESIYGNFTAAIGSDDFYKLQKSKKKY